MDECANAHAKQYIGKNLLKCFHDLIFGEDETVFLCQVRSCDVHAARLQRTLYDILQLIFQMKFLYDRTANHSDNESDNHIHDSDFRTEDTHQQNKASEIDHWR